jgi:GH25 family lysozyme M1 (1,4-beta-N-acetylmuramidase)
MGKKKTKALATALFLTTLTTIIALTAAVISTLLYLNEKTKTNTLTTTLITTNEQLTTTQAQNIQLEEAVSAFNEQETQLEEKLTELETATTITADTDQATEIALKEKAINLLLSENGDPLRALRELFPENFIYYDNDDKTYTVQPVLSEIPKHNLLTENLVQNDNGEMQYVENGEVVSYKGIDVSKYQGDINWSKVKSDGVDFAIIRLGLRGYESAKIVLDEYYEDNIKGANKAGIPTGVYFFTQAITVDEAIEEAEFVLDNILGYDVTCPIVFDVEMVGSSSARANTLSKEERTKITIAFCEKIKEAGYTPMIYGNVKCFTKLLDLTQLLDYEKWYAFYDDYMYMPYDVGFWQYSEKGVVSGIKEKVDLNISYKKLW